MICIRCRRKKFGVVRTKRTTSLSGRRNERMDLRRYYCLSCGKQYEVECEIKGVPVFDADLKIEKVVSVQEYVDEWMPGELFEVNEEKENGLFGGDDDG